MSLFSVMNVANKALFASQLGLSVTGHNMSNAEVRGYSRQRIDLSADYHRNPRFGQVGFGVDVLGISRIRNEYIDAQIRRQSHELGKNYVIAQTLESAENILNEPADNTGILEFMNKFFGEWENLTNNPADRAARTAVKNSAEMLTDVFHTVSSELQKLREDKNDEIFSLVGKINTIASELFNLNGEISIVELGGNSANDSKDRRDQLMRELSEIVDFDYHTDKDGQVTISVSGHILVSPVGFNKLEVYDDRGYDDEKYEYHRYGVRTANGKNTIIPKSGELKGLMVARDELIPKYEAEINQLAKVFVETINEVHRSGYSLRGYSGVNFFDPTCLDAKTMKLSAEILTNVDNIAAAKGGSKQKADTNLILAGGLAYGNPPVNLSKLGGAPWTTGDPTSNKAINITFGTVVVTVNGTNNKLIEDTDYKIDYVNGTIQMLNTAYDTTALDIDFEYRTSDFPGIGNNENAIEMCELRKKLTMRSSLFGEPTATFDQYYGSIIAELGLDSKDALAEVRTRAFLIEQYDDHQDSIAGVSLDEEMSNLVKYQYTYQAAARIFTTAQAMLDILLNL
ncbi:MAG: flagellar hook-associated protein FlgK [Chitinispirillales bacterium]|jgi:flagellar hook-associated protein 1 FlgK|nr:flagellar hook-associated protein FlgK [Chitinispirillales bacterium]